MYVTNKVSVLRVNFQAPAIIIEPLEASAASLLWLIAMLQWIVNYLVSKPHKLSTQEVNSFDNPVFFPPPPPTKLSTWGVWKGYWVTSIASSLLSRTLNELLTKQDAAPCLFGRTGEKRVHVALA